MSSAYSIYWPTFYTATNHKWLPLLAHVNCKQIIINSLRFLVTQKRARLFAFVIMENHIHLIWQALPPFSPSQLQLGFMKYTAQQIKFHHKEHNPALLEKCLVNTTGRKYQIWKREPLSIELYTDAVFNQKLEYIHYNPVKAGLCRLPEDYVYSSAQFHLCGIDHFNMLSE